MTGELTLKEMEAVLSSQHYAHLGCASQDEVYVVPITYLFKNNTIVSYTNEGKKVEMMRRNPNICVQVERIIAPDRWESVICKGLFEEVKDPDESHTIQLLLAKQFAELRNKGELVVSRLIDDLRRQDHPTAWTYRIMITEKTGRFQTMETKGRSSTKK